MQTISEHGAIDLIALKAAHPERYPCLLQSLARGAAPARYDLLFATHGEYLELAADGLRGSPGVPTDGSFLQALSDWQASQHASRPIDPSLPFRGGWVVHLAYELAAQIEPALGRLPAHASDWPIALALRCPVALLFDHQTGALHLIAEAHAESLASQVRADVAALAAGQLQESGLPETIWQLDEQDPRRYLDGVGRIQAYLAAGDTFQINLSRRWRAISTGPVDPHALYRRLARSNPAPFAGLLSWRGMHLLSSSPERLLEVRGDRVQTRPIAGTRPRRHDDDNFLSLPRDPKERAEHVMLIDLERNDLGRICVPGSIEVNELLGVETYAHVHHIVSNVRGRLRPGLTVGEIISACFPGGTITGCPKLRSMQIIAELEGEGRGPYTGALGYLDVSGDLDLNILIRSMLLQAQSLEFRAGAGIVVDSIPERELEETRAKAEGLLRAVR